MAGRVRAIKTRIGNVENVAQITKAMYTIAMTKVMRMKRQLAQTRPYLAALEALIADVLGQTAPESEPHPLTVSNESENVGILVLNADRGLCGRYKGELNRKAEELMADAGLGGRLLAGGEKARVFFQRRGVDLLRTYAHVYDRPAMTTAVRIADEVIELYRDAQIGRAVLVYMAFASDLAQRVVVQQLLPVCVEPHQSDMLREPDLAGLLDVALPLYVRGRLYAAILETKTSEDAIRRQAMRSATDNADDLIRSLTRSYNKARQQSITREIADILGGAEALRRE